MTFGVTQIWQAERWMDTTKERSSKTLHWLFCKASSVPINRPRRASSIAMDPRMQKRKSVIKKTGLEELKKELEMDEHQIHLEELATRLGTDLNSVSACWSVCTGPFWQLCSLNLLQSCSCVWYGSAYNINWYNPHPPLHSDTKINKLSILFPRSLMLSPSQGLTSTAARIFLKSL